MALFGLFRRKPHERTGFELYTAAVAAARDPALFDGATPLGSLPDTLTGRFEAIGLHVALLVRRLRQDADPRGAGLAQAVFDAMFADMDTSLREMGVGDMSIGKRVKRMWEDWHGRARAYEAALEAGDGTSLVEALSRNVWGGVPPEGAAEALAGRARAIGRVLDGQRITDLADGRVSFSPEEPLS